MCILVPSLPSINWEPCFLNFSFIFNDSFIEMWFTYQTIYPFKPHISMVFSKFTHLCYPLPCSWELMEASLHRLGWLDHWPLAADSTFTPPPLPRGQEGRTESSNPLITGMVLLATSSHPSVVSKSHLTDITKENFWLSVAWEIPRVLEALCQKQGGRPNIDFIL